ncbi:MAG: hypothetical protein WAN51_08125 [Alphaproteobacteria bacterium]
MSVAKKGKVFPKKGKIFPEGTERDRYAEAIAAALRQEVGGTHRAIKTVVRWSGVSERAAKNWLAGTAGPRGEHLVALTHHSDAVLEAFLLLAGKGPTIVAGKLVNVREKLLEAISLLQSIT